MGKYKNKYRIPSARLQNWDYGSAALYFITICTHDREHYFGDIADGQMELSEIGKIVEIEWLKTFDVRHDMNLSKGEFVVMPDHFHAIIGIGENSYNTVCGVECDDVERGGRDAMHRVSTGGYQNEFGPQSKNLASIIRGFKSAVTMAARKMNIPFRWQPRYHDSIIRDEGALHRTTNYIVNNPGNWKAKTNE